MNVERQQLEDAARTAGVEILATDASGNLLIGDIPNLRRWDPIANHGDRYRLARDCKMKIDFEIGEVQVPLGRKPSDMREYWLCERFTPGDDKQEGDAIVRAAAAAGREPVGA